MPLRGGESVGQAYVRIYATGDEVPGDIRRILRDSEPSVREGAKNHGKIYADTFETETTKQFSTHFGDDKEMFRGLNDNLTEQLSRIEIADTFFDHSLAWKKFLKRLDDEFGAAGRLAGKRLEAEFRDSTDLERLPDQITNIGVRVRKAQADILAGLYDDAYRENKAFDARIKALQNERDLAFRESVKDNKAAIIQFRNNIRAVATEIEKLEKGESKFTHRRLQTMVDDLRRLAPNLDLSSHQIDLFNDRLNVMGRHLDHTNPRVLTLHTRITHLGDTMGRLFGKGSRNNFLNFFGSFVSMLIKFPTSVLSKIASSITNFGRSISDAFTKAGGGGAGFLAGASQAFIGLAGAAANAGAAIIAFAAFVGFLGVVLGPVVAIISGLVGILLALSSSLIFAAIGSIVGFIPLIAPLAAIIGGIILAINRFKDAAGPLGDLFDTLETRAQKWLDVFDDRAFRNVERFGERLDDATRGLVPLFEAAGKGFNRFLDQMTEGFQDPAFDRFIDRFARFLPHAMKDLGDIISNSLGGIGGILTGAIPLSNRLLNWLTKITDKFNEWANSKEGQKEIRKFLRQAGDSAESFGDFLGKAWHWLTKIIGKSKDEGDTLWERIGGKFERWAKWIDEHPDAFEDWMADADKLATDISEIVDGLNQVIDALDSPRNRDIGHGILGFFDDFLTGSVVFIDAFDRLTSFIGTAVSNTIGGTWTVLQTVGSAAWYAMGGGWVDDLVRGIGTGLEAAGGAVAGAFQTFFSGLGKAFSGGSGGAMTINTTGIVGPLLSLPGRAQTAVEGMLRPFRGLAGRISTAAGDIAGRVAGRVSGLPGRIGGIVDQIVGRFTSLAGRINKAVGDIWASISGRFLTLPIQAVVIAARIVTAFAGLGARIVAAIGNIVIHPSIDWPDLGGHGVKASATGELVNAPSLRVIGEDGPEAVVPLNRPLSQVDPAVRWLSAIAQGLVPSASGGVGKVVDASGWQIVTPSEDPRIVATEVLNQLIAKAV